MSDSLQPRELQPTRLHGVLQAKVLDCHFLLQGDLPRPGIKLESSALAARFFTTVPQQPSLFQSQQNEKIKFILYLFYTELYLRYQDVGCTWKECETESFVFCFSLSVQSSLAHVAGIRHSPSPSSCVCNHSVAGSPFPQPFWSLSLPLTGQENNGKCGIQQFKTHFSPLLPSLEVSHINQRSPTFLVRGTSFKEDSFPTDCVGEQFQDDSNPLHLLCSLFLLLLYQLHFRSTGSQRLGTNRSQRLGTPGLNKFGDFKRDAQKLGEDTKHKNATVLPFSSQKAPNPVPVIFYWPLFPSSLPALECQS